jgi:hypothetical protein
MAPLRWGNLAAPPRVSKMKRIVRFMVRWFGSLHAERAIHGPAPLGKPFGSAAGFRRTTASCGWIAV